MLHKTVMYLRFTARKFIEYYRYFQYGFLYHAGDDNMIFKDKLKSTLE